MTLRRSKVKKSNKKLSLKELELLDDDADNVFSGMDKDANNGQVNGTPDGDSVTDSED